MPVREGRRWWFGKDGSSDPLLRGPVPFSISSLSEIFVVLVTIVTRTFITIYLSQFFQTTHPRVFGS